jgi:tRNA threonylcarbamoyladenosine biosynthesis protein TsaB
VLVLAVESATDTAGVALADEKGALGSIVVARGRRHTETISPAVETLCRRVGVTLSDLDAVGVDVGPGLFTGLRVGVGTVKALAFALDVPVVTATSLEILAHAVAGSGCSDGRLIVPVVDARRGEVFSTRFRAHPGPAGRRAVVARPVPGTVAGDSPTQDSPTEEGPSQESPSQEGLWDPGALAADLGSLDEPAVLVGDGALRYVELFGAIPGVTLAGSAYAGPPVAVLAELSVARARAGLVEDGAGVTPRYLRDADARINWEQRIAPRAAAGAGG